MRSSLDNVLPDVAFRRLSVASAFIFDVDRTLADPHERMEEGILSEWWTRSNPVPMIRDPFFKSPDQDNWHNTYEEVRSAT